MKNTFFLNKQERYEHKMDRQCKNLGWELYNNGIESTKSEQLQIAERLNQCCMDLDMVLDGCESVEDVLGALDY